MTSDHHHDENWLSLFVRQLQDRSVPADVVAHLVELHTIVTDLTRTQTQNQAALEEARGAIERLEKKFARAGKEQFKTNTLAEAQQQHVDTILEHLRDADTHRERELIQLRERLANSRSEGRLDVIKSVLPVLDGLGEAFASGERLLAHTNQTSETPTSPHRLTLSQRLRAAFGILMTSTPPVHPDRDERLSPQVLSAWLEGLTFVQDRLIDILADEDVHPIDTEGISFNPHLHVAVETSPASEGIAPDTIIRETRRGYIMGETVLRYAEVVVTRASPQSTVS